VLDKELKIMDMTAITLCKENKLSIGVLSIKNENSLLEFISGKKIGTIIS
jgi:uridylate kinase